MAVNDILGIRVQNIKSIIDAVRFEDGITKKTIADKTGLSFATVSNLCNELIEGGEGVTSKQSTRLVGRTPQIVFFNSMRYNTICLNLQMQGMMGLAILNFKNEVVFQKKYDISALKTTEAIITYAKQAFYQDFLDHSDTELEFIGVGVAVSSIFDINSERLINNAVDIFQNVKMKEIVEEIFDLPAYIDNEANLCALSIESSSNNFSNIVYLHISEGVGIGIIADGNLMRGNNGYAGEIAHMPVGNPEIQCPTCGNYGCIENNLSVNGFLRKMFGNYEMNRVEKWNAFIQAVQNQNDKALRMVKENGALLGKLSSILINLLDPEILYIGGDIASVFPYAEDIFWEQITSRCPLIAGKSFKVVCDNNSEQTINIGISEKICTSWSPS